MPKVSLPVTPNKYAKAIVNLIDTASPHKKQALENEHIGTTANKRAASTSIVFATTSAMSFEDKSVKKSLVKELRRQPHKNAVSTFLPVSKSTLHRRPCGKSGRPTLPDDTIQLIRDFYSRNENVTIFPNKRRGKSPAQPLRVLNYSKKKLFAVFKQEYPDKQVSISSFWKYKPTSIKRKRAARLLQCVCDVCENVSLILIAIRTSLQRSDLEIPDIIMNADHQALGFLTLCDSKQHFPQCLDRTCNQCGTHKAEELLTCWAEENPSDSVRWLTWKHVGTLVGEKSVKRLTKVACSSSRTELLAVLISKLETYGRHVFIARSQSKAFQTCLDTLGPSDCSVVVDFAENYTCLRQGEAQSAYYSRNQVTLHPMVVTMKRDGNVQRDSVVIVSNDLDHDSAAVSTFMETLFVHLSYTYPEIEIVNIWSDGCAAQYKSKQPFRNLCTGFHSNYNLIWNFYGSRHGKGAADGEAAVVKTFLSQEAKNPNVLLDDASQVFNHLSKSDMHVVDGASRRHFYYVSKEEVKPTRVEQKKLNIKTVPGTRRLHQIRPAGPAHSVKFRDVSCYCSELVCIHSSNAWKSFVFPGIGY